jgi:hypothetical protein
MESVFIEEGGEWFYDAATELYIRTLDGEVNAQVFGRYLASPADIRQAYSRDTTPAVKALYNHFNGGD